MDMVELRATPHQVCSAQRWPRGEGPGPGSVHTSGLILDSVLTVVTRDGLSGLSFLISDTLSGVSWSRSHSQILFCVSQVLPGAVCPATRPQPCMAQLLPLNALAPPPPA